MLRIYGQNFDIGCLKAAALQRREIETSFLISFADLIVK